VARSQPQTRRCPINFPQQENTDCLGETRSIVSRTLLLSLTQTDEDCWSLLWTSWKGTRNFWTISLVCRVLLSFCTCTHILDIRLAYSGFISAIPIEVQGRYPLLHTTAFYAKLYSGLSQSQQSTEKAVYVLCVSLSDQSVVLCCVSPCSLKPACSSATLYSAFTIMLFQVTFSSTLVVCKIGEIVQ